uniref:NAD(P)(+)--arginine ADP-ribosyltransferase n=1 Tax=Mola mola TaxID=94237 RepID=A0A3Q3XMM8_MOLML
PWFWFLGCLLVLTSLTKLDKPQIRSNPTQKAKNGFPLDMGEDSVDDMYFGCNKEMMQKVNTEYLKEEQKQNKNAWNTARKFAKDKLIDKKDKDLTELHLQAICVYTADGVYEDFNTAVRTNRSVYGSSFKFHSLHYLLTSAIQILNSNYHCHTTYRRISCSLTGNTCFEIKTCLGAYLKNYSCFSEKEQEVLIPPYEVFKITDKIDGQGKYTKLRDCKVVYVLEIGCTYSFFVSFPCAMLCSPTATTQQPVSKGFS